MHCRGARAQALIALVRAKRVTHDHGDDRDLILFVFVLVLPRLDTTLLHDIAHVTKGEDGKQGHPLPLVLAKGLIERLPGTSELLKVG